MTDAPTADRWIRHLNLLQLALAGIIIMAFASAAAALKCTRSGGRAGIPSINDCLAFMRTHQ